MILGALADLDRAACGLLQTSADGTFRRVNIVFAHWLGYEPGDLVGARRIQELLTMGGRSFHQTHWAPLLNIQGSISEVKLELVHRDGSTIPMVLDAIRRDEDGIIVHEIAAFIARDRAQYAEQMIGIVSHDLRNPLSTIAMASQLLATAPQAMHPRIRGHIDRAVARATHLLGDLLDFTAARVGRGIAVAPELVRFHAVVAEALEGLRLANPTRTLVHTSDGAGTITLDPQRLAQALGNLVTNAVTYGEPATPIEIVSRLDDTGCTLEVTNTGTQIPPDKIAAIFEPMTRGSAGGASMRSVALGLYIVQQIAKAHGGTASARSTPAGITTFSLTFPR